jgi:putative phosphoesterase
MKIALISDIHGNYEALKAVLQEIDRMKITDIYCLGDVAGYYPQINECCEELISRNIPCIMGNHDWYMAGGGFCTRSGSVNDCLAYQRKIIIKSNLNWLKRLPFYMQVEKIKMLHGGWSNPIDEYLLDPNEDYFLRIDGNVFVSGHTHIQTVRKYHGKIYCNPGSVGQPRDGNPEAAFAVYDGNFELHRIEYNMKKVFELMDNAGFHDYYYGCLKTGARNLCRLF